MSYEGPDRRKRSLDEVERDRLLTKIDADQTHFIQRFDRHVVTFDQHVINDSVLFVKMTEKVDKLNMRMAFWAGGLAVIAIFLKVFV